VGGGEKDTRRTRAERDSGQNSGARRVDRMSLPLSLPSLFPSSRSLLSNRWGLLGEWRGGGFGAVG
jgi:hypothetical protein